MGGQASVAGVNTICERCCSLVDVRYIEIELILLVRTVLNKDAIRSNDFQAREIVDTNRLTLCWRLAHQLM